MTKYTKQKVKVKSIRRCIKVTEHHNVDETGSKGKVKKRVYKGNRKHHKVEETESKGKVKSEASQSRGNRK